MTYSLGSTTISCGVEAEETNAYLLGKDVFDAGKHPLFRWQDDLINSLIHRSWGDGFVNIFLDLSMRISRSNTIFVCDLVARILIRVRLVRYAGTGEASEHSTY
jgi:hypothetical protein